jgi:hypothetical protein
MRAYDELVDETRQAFPNALQNIHFNFLPT